MQRHLYARFGLATLLILIAVQPVTSQFPPPQPPPIPNYDQQLKTAIAQIAPVKPVLVAPANNSQFNAASGVTFSWQTNSPGVTFDFFMAKSEAMLGEANNANCRFKAGLTTNSVTLPASELSTFYGSQVVWVVKAKKSGHSNLLSDIWKVTLNNGNPPPPPSNYLAWNSTINSTNFPKLNETGSYWPAGVKERVQGTTIAKIINSASDVRPTAGEFCSSCHYAYGDQRYQPNVSRAENTLNTNKKINPGTTIRQTYHATGFPERKWNDLSSSWVDQFVASSSKPQYLKDLFKKWKDDGRREN